MEGGNIDILKNYQKIFSEKSLVFSISEKIKSKDWETAQDYLNKIDDSPDKQRLELMMAFEKMPAQKIDDQAYFLEQNWSSFKNAYDNAEAILLEIVENAWKDKANQALENSLISLINRVVSTSKKTNASLDKLEKWREWLKIEKKVLADDTDETTVEKLYYYTKEKENINEISEIIRLQKKRIIDYWKEKNSLVLLIWAETVWDETLVSGNHLFDFNLNSEHKAKEILNILKEKKSLKVEEVRDSLNELMLQKNHYDKIKNFLDLTGKQSERIETPEPLTEAIDEIKILLNVLTVLVNIKSIDLRNKKEKEAMDEALFNMRKYLEDYSVRGELLKIEEKLLKLKNLTMIEDNIRKSALDCGDDKNWRKKDLFAVVRLNLLDLKEMFKSAGLLNEFMWKKISAEYTDFIFDEGCLFIEKPLNTDILNLINLLEKVIGEENEFRQQVDRLWKEIPVNTQKSLFVVDEYRSYLSHFPDNPPNSKRDYLYFKHSFADQGDGRQLLNLAEEYLPDWIQKYMKEGSPECSDKNRK